MASTDFRIAGTGSNDGAGFTDWLNPTRIALNDGLGASVTTDGSAPNGLLSGLHNVGINLTAAIIGMEVKVDVLTNTMATTTPVTLTTSASFTKFSDFKSIGIGQTGEITLGGPTDLWLGANSSAGYIGFTAAEVSTATFGIEVLPSGDPVAGHVMSVDYVAIKLYISDLSVVSPIPMLGGASC